MTAAFCFNCAIAIIASPIILVISFGYADRAAPEPASQGLRRPNPGGWKCITPHAIVDCLLSLTRLSEVRIHVDRASVDTSQIK